MAIYTFSTKTKRPEDTAMVEELKELCDRRGLNFSSVVLDSLKTWKLNDDQRSAKVQNHS